MDISFYLEIPADIVKINYSFSITTANHVVENIIKSQYQA